MGLRYGADTPQALYVGADLVSRVYVGADLVWPEGAAAPENTSPPVIYAAPVPSDPPANLTPPLIFNTAEG